MSNYDWEEVKKLAADFQRAQHSTSAQRLSERNCIEIINKLTQTKLLDVVYTADGKSYITPKYLTKEIKDELYVHGGRVNLIDVAKSLNIDFNVVNTLALEIVKEDQSIRMILGQLIDQSFVVHAAEEINDKLQQHGFVSISELARTFDLPGDFIQTVIKESSGRIICGVKQDKQDAQIYYTETFLNQNKAIVKGALVAVTKPTLLSTVMSHCKIKENIFFSLIDSLVESKQIPGVLTERCGSVCTYIPHIYLKAQSEWVKNFYKQNGYLEYDALTRVGINDPKSFIAKSINSEENLQYLQNCAVGKQLLEQIEANVEDITNSQLWMNILNVLPSTIDSDDAETMLRNITNKQRNLSDIRIFNHSYAVSEQFLNHLNSTIMEKIVPDHVNECVNSGKYEQFIIESKIGAASNENEKRELTKKEERKKRANVGKSGGGTQGRETKTKAVKKKYGQKNATNKNDSDEEEFKSHVSSSGLELVSIDEIKSAVENDTSFQDDDYDDAEFIDELAEYLYPLVNKAANSLAQEAYEARLANINNTKRKMNAELQDNIISAYQDLKQYQKGIREFDDECQIALNKYLLKTTGTELVNTCFSFVSDKNEEVNSNETRQKVLSTISNKGLKDLFTKLHKSVNGSSVEEFIVLMEAVLDSLNIMMKKIDKKKEKFLLESHKQALIGKLKETNDTPPIVLHLAVLILFQTVTQSMITASGRFVSDILAFLAGRIPADSLSVLQQYHGSVKKLIILNESDEEYTALIEELKDSTVAVKEIVLSFDKK